MRDLEVPGQEDLQLTVALHEDTMSMKILEESTDHRDETDVNILQSTGEIHQKKLRSSDTENNIDMIQNTQIH